MRDAAELQPRVEYHVEADVVSRNELFLRFAGLFAAIWVVLVTVAGYWFWSPIALAMTAAIWFVVRATARVAIVADGETLVVTNTLRTHRLQRSEIARFVIDQTFRRPFTTFEVRLKDHSAIHCEAMEPGNRWRVRPDIEQCRNDLTRWLNHPLSNQPVDESTERDDGSPGAGH